MYLCIYPSIHLSICRYIYLSIYGSIDRSRYIYLSVSVNPDRRPAAVKVEGRGPGRCLGFKLRTYVPHLLFRAPERVALRGRGHQCSV